MLLAIKDSHVLHTWNSTQTFPKKKMISINTLAWQFPILFLPLQLPNIASVHYKLTNIDDEHAGVC